MILLSFLSTYLVHFYLYPHQRIERYLCGICLEYLAVHFKDSLRDVLRNMRITSQLMNFFV